MSLAELDETSLILQDLEQELRRRNLPIPPPPPPVLPDVPHDITSVSSETVMEAMVMLDGLTSFARTLAGRADTVAAEKANAYRVKRAEAFLALREEKATGTRMTNEEIQARLDANSELNRLRDDQLKAEAFRGMVRTLASGYESKGAILSRELSRRASRGEKE